MGYYTKYELEIIGRAGATDHQSEISKLSGYDSCFSHEIKWYAHEAEMREYSKRYPKLVFKLSGEGEDNGDLWVKYFKNGKMCGGKAKIVYPEYKEDELE